MNFQLTDEQKLVQATARKFADEVLAPRAAERDRKDLFPTDELHQLAELGLLGVNIPARFGGAEAGVVAYSLAMTEIARADASVSVAMAVTNMVGEVICHFAADEADQARWVAELTSGRAVAGAFGLSETGAGSDPAAMTTTAKPDDDGFVLDGAKQWITSGADAGVIVVWAQTAPPRRTITKARADALDQRFIIERGTPGLSAGRPEDKMGLRGSSTVPLHFDSLRLPRAALLGQLGGGLSVALAALDGGRIGIASQSVGLGRAALAAATSYVKVRHQFGRPLADNQAIQFMLADIATELDAAQLLTLRAAWLKEQRRPFSREAAMAKLYASEAAGRACDRAVQMHGGYGYTRDYPVERYLRDARVTRIYEGTSEVQRIVIARSLLAST